MSFRGVVLPEHHVDAGTLEVPLFVEREDFLSGKCGRRKQYERYKQTHLLLSVEGDPRRYGMGCVQQAIGEDGMTR